jgi:hypothetical protein
MVDNGDGKWIFGGIMALLSLIGLLMASRAIDATFYWTGLAFFLFGVLAIFGLIGKAYGPPPPRRRGSEEEETPS